ncbi:MAG: type IV secretory system conjugative DNA transfer family protein [Natronospirillum sp.]
MSRTNENLSADIVAFFGATGSGKTHNMLQDCKADKRILAFDPTGTLSGQGFEGFSDFGAWFRAAVNSGPGRYALQLTGPKHFSAWCEAVMAMADARRPCTVLVDELGAVTTPTKAPEHWHNLISLGRKYGLKIRAGAQRAPEIDKTLIGNKSGLWIGFQSREADAAYLARETDIPLETIKALRPKPHFDHIWYKGRGDYKLIRR